MDSGWKEVVVSDESVTKAASDLRRFFIANNLTKFNLVTISKLGYKLEIIDFKDRKSSFIWRVLKTIGYILAAFLLIIIILRAINY